MALIHNNIRFLRRTRGLTQEALARELDLTRAVIGAYEEGRAEPKLPALQRIAAFFNVTLDELIGANLEETGLRRDEPRAEPPTVKPVAPADPTDVTGRKLRVLSITVDAQERENIELVPQKAAAGYLNGYADPEYLEQLPRFRLPMLPPGTYRAFEISGDSMLPLQPGAIVIGEFVENWNDIRDGQTYVLVTGREGVVYKRVYNHLLNEGRLSLHSDNPAYLPFDVDADDLMEVWRAKAYISLSFPDSEMNLQKLAGIVMELQKEVIKLKG